MAGSSKLRMRVLLTFVVLCGMAGITKDFVMAQDDLSDDPSFDVGGGEKMKIKLAEAKAPR